jgi:hypothetical protein
MTKARKLLMRKILSYSRERIDFERARFEWIAIHYVEDSSKTTNC